MGCPACKYAPSEFKQRITIQEKTETQDDTGGMTTSWVAFATVWSKVTPKHGSEQLLSQRIDAVDVYEILIRYLPGVTEKMRISYNSRIFQIKSVIVVDELNEFMSIRAVDEGQGT